MARRKRLQELTIKDNFMFGAVMTNEENCREFLELVLGFPIEMVTVSKEKSILYHPEYKGIRLDIIAKDKAHTHYNIEMQMVKKPYLGKRSRYYHSQIDMELLLSGNGYDKLPNTYVIFICDYDPFGRGNYCYTFEAKCREDDTVFLEDGSVTIFLNTHGTNDKDISQGLVNFLKFVKAELNETYELYEDAFVRRLQSDVKRVKDSREMEERYMLFQELLHEEREEGKAEGKAEAILDLLSEFGEEIPASVKDKINLEKDLEVLKGYLKAASKAESLDDFMKSMQLL